jgi:hypothetical protein
MLRLMKSVSREAVGGTSCYDASQHCHPKIGAEHEQRLEGFTTHSRRRLAQLISLISNNVDDADGTGR